MSTRKVPVLPEFIERIEQLVSPKMKVDYDRHRTDIEVTCDDKTLLDVMISKSNSGRSFQLLGSGINTNVREWDVFKIRQIVMCALAGEMTQGHSVVTSRGSVLLKELRLNPDVRLPAIVEQVVKKIHEIYPKIMGGEDFDRRVAEVKKLFDLLKDSVSEDEVLQWYREAHVKKVMES
jgi:hypothetical protein